MAKFRGTFEYDDDDLTPGKKKGAKGGWSQNLYDSNGDLKAGATFIPDTDQPDDWDEQHDYTLDPNLAVELELEERRREIQRQEDFALAVKVVFIGARWAFTEGRPWWREKARPALRSTWEKRPRRRRKKTLPASEPMSIGEMRVVIAQELEEATADYRSRMTSSEAQARVTLAMILRALSDEQLSMVANADVVLDETQDELERRFTELPTEQATLMIERLLDYPSLIASQLTDFEKLLKLASSCQILKRQRRVRPNLLVIPPSAWAPI